MCCASSAVGRHPARQHAGSDHDERKPALETGPHGWANNYCSTIRISKRRCAGAPSVSPTSSTTRVQSISQTADAVHLPDEGIGL